MVFDLPDLWSNIVFPFIDMTFCVPFVYRYIGTSACPCDELKYLLGPIDMGAHLKWCLSPREHHFKLPEIDVDISMNRLSLSLSKYQYQNFKMLLENFEYDSRAAAYRKYKAKHQLEHLTNYKVVLNIRFIYPCNI